MNFNRFEQLKSMIKEEIQQLEKKISFKFGIHYSNEDKIAQSKESLKNLKLDLQELKNKQKAHKNQEIDEIEEVFANDSENTLAFSEACDEIERIEYLIQENEKELKTLQNENVKLSCYKSKDQVRNLLIKEQQQEILNNWFDFEEYKPLNEEYNKLNNERIKILDKYAHWTFDECGLKDTIDFKNNWSNEDNQKVEQLNEQLANINRKLRKFERIALNTAQDIVDGDESEIENRFYELSGQKEHDDLLKEIENLKQQLEIVEMIVSDYQNEKFKITMNQMDEFVKMFNRFANELKNVQPIDESYNVPICKVKYYNKIYEVYDFEIIGSCLVDFRKCNDLNGKQRIFNNKYFLEVEATQEDVKPIDQIEIDGIKYNVYKQQLPNSIKKDRIKRKSLITNKVRDFRNVYLVVLN